MQTDASPRIEGGPKVTGTARYTAETAMADLVHAALVTATVASARITAIDTARAAAMPGVIAVLTHETLPGYRQAAFLALLHEPVVHFPGQPVAAVIAATPAQARLAASAVTVTYETRPAVTTLAQAPESFVPRDAGRVPATSRRGDPEAALAAAAVVLDRRYTTPVNNHHPMEPHAVIAAWEGDDRLTVHTTTQAIFATRRVIAHCFGLQPDRVRVVTRYLGGGFGTKGPAWFPCLMLGIAAARAVGRPVRLELTRAQMATLVGRRQETVQHLRLGAARDGQITAIMHDTLAQTSAFADYADPTGAVSRWLYACPNVETVHRLARVNAPLPIPARAPGEGPGSFALESALDELAHQLDIDPVELRRRNFADRDQHGDRPWSSNGLLDCYRVGAERFGWAGRPAVGTVRDGRELVGWGMASAAYPVYRIASAALVRITPDGLVEVRCGTQDMGSGTYTVLGQVAATTLGVPLARVSVELGDTLLPEGPYSGGSLATASFQPAVAEAAATLRHRLIALAVADAVSPLHGVETDEVEIVDGYVRAAGNRTELLAELVRRSGADGVEGTARTVPDDAPVFSSNGYGAVFAEVRVDAELGRIRVTRLTAAYAAGRILNPLLSRSQYVGGLVWGIGMALHEATVTDAASGRILNDNLSDYLIPVHADMPQFDIAMLDEHDPHLAGGIKGIGMLGTVGTAAAIANAVFHATGRRLRDLPLRLEDCLL